MKRSAWWCWLLLAVPTSLPAAPKPNSQEKRDDQRVNAARSDVAEAQRKLAEESKDVREAATAWQKAVGEAQQEARTVAELRVAAQGRIEQQEDLAAAQSAVQVARTQFEAASKPVLDRLRATPEYQAANAAAETARKRLEAGDAAETASLREATFVPGRLETAAVAADAEAVRLRSAMDDRAKRLADLRRRIDAAVDADSSVLRGLSRLNAAKEAVEKAERHLAAERAKAIAAIAKLQQEEAQLRQAIAQDKKNDQKNKKPAPKKKQPQKKK